MRRHSDWRMNHNLCAGFTGAQSPSEDHFIAPIARGRVPRVHTAWFLAGSDARASNQSPLGKDSPMSRDGAACAKKVPLERPATTAFEHPARSGLPGPARRSPTGSRAQGGRTVPLSLPFQWLPLPRFYYRRIRPGRGKEPRAVLAAEREPGSRTKPATIPNKGGWRFLPGIGRDMPQLT